MVYENRDAFHLKKNISDKCCFTVTFDQIDASFQEEKVLFFFSKQKNTY